VSEDEIFWLYLMQAIAEPLLGFANGVIYGSASYRAIFVKLGWFSFPCFSLFSFLA